MSTVVKLNEEQKINQQFPLTQAMVESVCDPKEYGDKTKYPFINYLPFNKLSKEFLEYFERVASKFVFQPPNPPTIEKFRAMFVEFYDSYIEQGGKIRDKSKCEVTELFIKDKISNNIVNAHQVKYEGASSENGVIIDCHGGGYVLFDVKFHYHFAEIISKLTKCVVILLNYKLAPEFPLPIAVNELVFLYKYVLNEYEGGVPSTKVAIMGDSAGGGMVLLGLQAIKYGRYSMLKLPQPSCVWLNSPWCNITDDATEKYKDSPLYTDDDWSCMSEWAVGNRDGDYNVVACNGLRNEIYSPQFGKFEGLAPMYFMVGATEIGLNDNGIECAKKAYERGVEVKYDIAPFMGHCWPVECDGFPEAMESCKNATEWIVNHFRNGTTNSTASKL